MFFVKSKETGYCPICGEMLYVRGLRKRVMIEPSGKKINLKIRRMMCEKCKRIHHELPDCIVPYKRHCRESIENIIEGKTREVPCSDRVIRIIILWWSIVSPYFLNILKTLEEKLGIKYPEPPALCEIVRAVANTNNWIFANSICTRSE